MSRRPVGPGGLGEVTPGLAGPRLFPVSFLFHAVVLLALAGVFVFLAVVAAAYLVRRRVRRTWDRVQSHVVTRGVLAAPSVLAAWRDRFEERASPEEASLGTPARVRRHMWNAMEDAERAVQHADSVHAPVAELPSICRALRRAGEDLDHLLRVGRRLPTDPLRPDPVRRQVAELIHAAQDVQSAAVCACSEANEPRLRSLVRDARDEVQIVAAALSRMRSFTSH
jgi:hypothetical protein